MDEFLFDDIRPKIFRSNNVSYNTMELYARVYGKYFENNITLIISHMEEKNLRTIL